MNDIFLLCFNLTACVFSSHIGHARYPLTQHPAKFPYAGKSLIVHKKIAQRLKLSCRYASYAVMPTSHNNLKSSTKGAKYTSISFPGCLGPEINRISIINFLFMHNHRGRLYVIIKTGQQLYVQFINLWGFTPSAEMATLRFRGLNQNPTTYDPPLSKRVNQLDDAIYHYKLFYQHAKLGL